MFKHSLTLFTARTIAFMFALLLATASTTGQAADAPNYTAQTSMALILDKPAARAVMAKYLPAVMSDPQIEGARVISIGELAGYIPDQLTAEVMTKLLADLNALEE